MQRSPLNKALLQHHNIRRGNDFLQTPTDVLALETWSGQWLNLHSPLRIARLSLGAHLIALAQAQYLQCVWVTTSSYLPYAPDLHAAGVVLEQLPVVEVPGTTDALDAAALLMMRHCADLVVVEGAWHQMIPRKTWAKLSHWARRYACQGMLLTAAGVVEGARHLVSHRSAHNALHCHITTSTRKDIQTSEVRYDDMHRVRLHPKL